MNNSTFLLMVAFTFLFGGTALTTNTLVVADESDSIYGKGVHAFFDRDYEGAVKILQQVENSKSNDPRPFYFLGLAHLRQEKTEEADQYFKQAARLEYSGRALRDYAVSESLRRIQGQERLRVEKIRTEELANAQKREQQLREARYGSEKAAGRDALRQLAPQAQQDDDVAVLKDTAENQRDNPFGVKGINPFAEGEAVAVKRADTNPFGDVVTEESEEAVVPELILPVMNRPAPSSVRPGGTAARTNAPAAQGRENVRVGVVGATTAALLMRGSPDQQVTRETARVIGKGLGSLFSRKSER